MPHPPRDEKRATQAPPIIRVLNEDLSKWSPIRIVINSDLVNGMKTGTYVFPDSGHACSTAGESTSIPNQWGDPELPVSWSCVDSDVLTPTAQNNIIAVTTAALDVMQALIKVHVRTLQLTLIQLKSN